MNDGWIEYTIYVDLEDEKKIKEIRDKVDEVLKKSNCEYSSELRN